jgi:hypothetical protein
MPEFTTYTYLQRPEVESRRFCRSSGVGWIEGIAVEVGKPTTALWPQHSKAHLPLAMSCGRAGGETDDRGAGLLTWATRANDMRNWKV